LPSWQPYDITIRQTEEYRRWFARLRDDAAKARILARLRRVSAGNLGDASRLVAASASCGSIMVPVTASTSRGAATRLVLLLTGVTNRASAPILNVRKGWPPRWRQMMAIETFPWDAAEHLDSDEMILAYLEAVSRTATRS
jgi:hypothetical protein